MDCRQWIDAGQFQQGVGLKIPLVPVPAAALAAKGISISTAEVNPDRDIQPTGSYVLAITDSGDGFESFKSTRAIWWHRLKDQAADAARQVFCELGNTGRCNMPSFAEAVHGALCRPQCGKA